MAIKIRSSQLQVADTFDFSSGTLRTGTPSGATDAANKAYVDAQVRDALAGGDGIAIADGAGTDTISVDLATNPGLKFTSNKLDVKVKSESGGSITKDADGLYIGDGAIASAKLAGSIANAKLANSTISGKALGANLDNLAAGQGLALGSPYNGSAAQTMDLNLDGSTLAKGASGVKVADGGIATGQLANDCVTSAKVADGAINANSMLADAVVTGPKLSVQPFRQVFAANGSATAFTVTGKNIYTGGEDGILVFRNGLLIEAKESSPSGQDEYTFANSGSDLVITFGAAPTANDSIQVMAILIS